MKFDFKKIAERIDALSLRERGLLLFAVLFVLYFLWSGLLMGPLEKRHKQLGTELKQLRSANATLATQVEQIGQRQQADPDAENRARLAQLNAELGALDQRIKTRTRDLIDPAAMAKVLEDVLSGEHGLKLIAVHSLPASPLLESEMHGAITPPAGRAQVPGIYRHGMVLEFEGGYLDALHYLRALEALRWHLFWDSVEFKVLKYPLAHYTVTVHTLSLREGWIGV